MKYCIHGFNQVEVTKINKELGMEVKLKRNPNWKPNTEDIIIKGGKTRKRPEPKLPKIGNDELLILRWFVDFYGTGKMAKLVIEEKQYAMIKYQSILDDLPILDINKNSLYNIFQNLVDFKILTHNTLKNELGTFAGYYFGENYNRLIAEIKPSIENNTRVS